MYDWTESITQVKLITVNYNFKIVVDEPFICNEILNNSLFYVYLKSPWVNSEFLKMFRNQLS